MIGSGTLITFPALLAVGYPPVVANVSNSLGLVPGAASSAYGYRRELAGSRERLLRFAPLTATGAIVGAVLLLALPESAFEVIVPILIAISLVLILAQPRISAWVKARREAEEEGRAPAPHGGPAVQAGIFGTGIYGGYFGAGQGILLACDPRNRSSRRAQGPERGPSRPRRHRQPRRRHRLPLHRRHRLARRCC